MSHFPTNPYDEIQQLKKELAGSLSRNLELDGDIATLEQEAKQMRARMERLERENDVLKSQVKVLRDAMKTAIVLSKYHGAAAKAELHEALATEKGE